MLRQLGEHDHVKSVARGTGGFRPDDDEEMTR